ncbi:MAG TPA: 16S rRNA (cytosine(1402)-N(4))-methyltransferase RsmH [Candidatus Binatia bacterium]|jgi:16S rRNA (cytosine1402-N4)-methyltransferase|nr:16S rRNA (cytosine(1402)-N(4))-methyltransferase RsmH [Candidatus Binatia bacterium]
MAFTHVSVMAREVIDFLRPESRKRYLDGTLGGGGHTEQILIHSNPDGRVLGLDLDDEALATARQRLIRFGDRLVVRQANFAAAGEILSEIGWPPVDGIVLDLGVSSHQLESPERGFSFQGEARLDMRMDRRQSLDAYQIVNTFSISELARILRKYGEEPRARRIALAIASERKMKTIKTTEELAAIVARVKGKGGRDHHPATQTFQALRIAVNQELENLDRFLENGYELLQPKSRMVVISFHSLEDRLVKTAFRKWNRECLCAPRTPTCQCGWSRKVKLLTTRPFYPSPSEIEANPRARSAKLRAVERI